MVESPEPTLRALAPGTAVVTATVGQFIATSTVTVASGTIILVPGTTRWLVQSTPGFTLEKVIYTNQTNPDVPEAVLLESVQGADIQLRGVTDGRTTSVTPVVGDMPSQTMGDSFGGVLLVQHVDERSLLQRVGFTPDVVPWRWVANGSLNNVVQTHDGTIFATEVLGSALGGPRAAAVVVLDGATGVVRARVPISQSRHSASLLSDGSSNCAAEQWDIQDYIGLTAHWALTTTDVYGVITVEDNRDADNCTGTEYRGHEYHTEYLLAVNRDGGSTLTQVYQLNETFPSSSGNSSSPAPVSLSADARDGFALGLDNGDVTVIGPNAGSPAQPLGLGTMIAINGDRVVSDGSVVKAFDESGVMKWASSTTGDLIAQGDDGHVVLKTSLGLVELDSHGAFVREVPLANATGVAYKSSGEWTASIQAAYLRFVAMESRSPHRLGTGGNLQEQGAGNTVKFRNFVPVDVLYTPPPPSQPYRAALVERDFKVDGSVENFLVAKATLGEFVDRSTKTIYAVGGGIRTVSRTILRGDADAVAFIGHGVRAKDLMPLESAGVSFFDLDLIKAPDNFGDTWWLGERGEIAAIWTEPVRVSAKVLFMANCWSGALFRSLWQLPEGGAMIVPIHPHDEVDLSRAVTAWISIAKDLEAGCTVGQAINRWNRGAYDLYDYRIEGESSARLRPRRPNADCQ